MQHYEPGPGANPRLQSQPFHMLIVDAKAASLLSVKRFITICVYYLAFKTIHLVSIGTVFVLLFGIAVRGIHSIMQLFELQPGFTYALLQVCRVMCGMQRVVCILFQLCSPQGCVHVPPFPSLAYDIWLTPNSTIDGPSPPPCHGNMADEMLQVMRDVSVALAMLYTRCSCGNNATMTMQPMRRHAA